MLDDDPFFLHDDELPGRGRTYGYEIGWRIWTLIPSGELESYLQSSYTWPINRSIIAHKRPEGTWSICGLHCFNSFDTLMLWASRLVGGPCGDIVYGRVALWGHVIEAKRGFMSTHAFPLSLQVVPAHATQWEHSPEINTWLTRALALYQLPKETEKWTLEISSDKERSRPLRFPPLQIEPHQAPPGFCRRLTARLTGIRKSDVS